MTAALLVFALASPTLAQHEHAAAKKPAQEPVYNDLPSAGKKCWIGDEYYFKWKWDKKPKLGTAILIVQLYDKGNKRVTDWEITGVSDMPSMRGAHDSGEVFFLPNKKNDLLLPVNVVMPGEWEVKLTFYKDKKPFYRGRILFKV
jgi:hypothetical protein